MKHIIPEQVLFVLNTIKSNGFDCYIVGGCVRDFLLGEPIKDFDITTNARPEVIENMFEKTYDVGKSFGTIIVHHNDMDIEVTTFRSEKYDRQSRKPEVEYSDNIEEDLSRRDFTINAIAYDLSNDKFVDPYNGRDDIRNKIIRTTGNPVTIFKDDPLRILRMVRFASKYEGFKVEDETNKCAEELCLELSKVSAERKRDELEKILNYDYSLFSYILSNIFENISLYTYLVNKNMHFVSKIICLSNRCVNVSDLKEEFKLTNKEEKILSSCLNKVHNCGTIKDYQSFKYSIFDIGLENMDYFIESYNEYWDVDLSEYRDKLLESNDPISLKQLKITGSDLIQLGIKEGYKIGFVLKKCMIKVIFDELENTKESLLEYAKNFIH